MFNTLIVQPFGWVLRQCFELVGSYGVALIIFTIFAKLVLLPFQMKSKKSMMDMQRIQPRLKELEAKYKDDKERYAQEVQKLYKKENVSMFGGCLPLLITMPIMIGLYNVVRQPLTYVLGLSAEQITAIAEAMRTAGAAIGDAKGYMVEISVASMINQYHDVAAAVVPGLGQIDFNFLGLDLAAIPNFKYITPLWIIPILSGLTSYGYSWFMRRSQGAAGAANQPGNMNGMMNFMMPLMSVYIAFIVPAGLGFYWIISNLLSAIQEPLLTVYYKRKQEKEVLSQGGKANGKKH